MTEVTESQVLFAAHLLAWLRSLDPFEPIGMTAGGLLQKLEKLPAPTVPIRIVSPRPLARRRLRIGQGESLVRQCLGQNPGLSAAEISERTGVIVQTIGKLMNRLGCVHDGSYPKRWRLPEAVPQPGPKLLAG